MIYESGKQYTLVGIEADWLWAIGLLHGEAAMQSVVDGLDALGVNHVLVQIYAHSTSGQKLPPLQPPRVSPTPTTPWASADQRTLDLVRGPATRLDWPASRGPWVWLSFLD